MSLYLDSLEKALTSFKKAVDRSLAEPEDKEIRDSVIQRFEYTYELCWKMIKRRLEADAPNPQAIDQLSFRDLMREAAQHGLIIKVEPWFEYRSQRNITSHIYDEEKAESVYATALKFVAEAARVLAELQKRNRD